jgi:hypothetical protein
MSKRYEKLTLTQTGELTLDGLVIYSKPGAGAQVQLHRVDPPESLELVLNATRGCDRTDCALTEAERKVLMSWTYAEFNRLAELKGTEGLGRNIVQSIVDNCVKRYSTTLTPGQCESSVFAAIMSAIGSGEGNTGFLIGALFSYYYGRVCPEENQVEEESERSVEH